jgi:cytidine deaminase
MATKLTKAQCAALVEEALDARVYAYCPYSGFAVGAALLDKNGTVWTGVNVENAAYGPTNCAERTAFFKAVSEGVTEFLAIAVVGGPLGEEPLDFCAPCGVCRQVMREFCDTDFKIYMITADGYEERTLAQLLPDSFTL